MGKDSAPIGTLYGLGVGPGDPDLLTLKAVRILGEVDLVFTAASPGNDYSLAQMIAAPHLKPGIEVRRLNFPMVGQGPGLDAAWRANALEIAAELKAGLSAAFLTLGDPSTYSTYSYVLPYLAELLPPGHLITVPGIASYQLAAARANRPLVSGLESLTIISGVEDPENFSGLLDLSDNVAILKTYRSYDGILELLKKKNLLDQAVLYSKVGLPDEEIRADLDGRPLAGPPYLSLMIVKKRKKT
ncbi:MAG: precorrin-2 C(20)-methyltransferase [Candidatus Adiutrix sp.]|jgi:precorrin-2/cobalt-factor-2 C20-methyltransferase|nr:precorrin-2 C(20)-methyltransferase [Candidatus Adiutrix sp.]